MQELNKKGQTLVEVVVALAIIALVFAGTVTLIANLSNLILSSRNKTEAIALAQGGMATLIEMSRANCSAELSIYDGGHILNGIEYIIEGRSEYYIVDVNNEFVSTTDLSSAEYVRFNLKVEWEDKSIGSNEYKYSEIIKI